MVKKLKHFFTNTWEILKYSRRNFLQGEPIVYSAAIAFFTIFSLPAILIILMFAGSIFFSESTVRSQLVKEVESLVSEQASTQVSSILENAVEAPTGFWGITIGLVIIIQSSTITFFIIQKALNAVWQVRTKPGVGLVQLLKNRLSALAMVANLGLLFALSLLFDTLVAMLGDQLRMLLEEHFSSTIQVVNTVFYLTIVYVFFTAILKILPDVKVPWKDALMGGAITDRKSVV